MSYTGRVSSRGKLLKYLQKVKRDFQGWIPPLLTCKGYKRFRPRRCKSSENCFIDQVVLRQYFIDCLINFKMKSRIKIRLIVIFFTFFSFPSQAGFSIHD